MQTELPHPLLSRLSELLTLQMGLHYPPTRWGDLERGITAAAPALGMANTETCVRQLLSASLTRKQIEILACHLTVGETYFFREKRCFEVLEDRLFPELMRACSRANRPLRIWSAGCCTGEEPYSIAMLLDRLISHSGEWNATILATDINPMFLQKAAEGLYSEWSFRNAPPWIKERYFKRRKNGKFEILPQIRKRVTFSYLNLVEDAYPSPINDTSAMDVIFCRNVLMYFSPEWIKKVGQNFHRSLTDGGWFIVSPVETSNTLFSRFKATTFSDTSSDVVIYRKAESPEPQIKTAKYSTSMPDPLPDVLRMPAPALAQTSFLQNEEIARPLKNTQTDISPAATNRPIQPVKVQHVASAANLEEINALCRTARSHANLGELVEAVKWCEKAIAANKLNPAAHFLLATIREELGQNEIATQSLIHTLYLDPDFVLAHFALGNLCLSQSRLAEAMRHFDNALTLLHPYPYDELLPESGGLTAGRLTQIIASVRSNLSHRPREHKEKNTT